MQRSTCAWRWNSGRDTARRLRDQLSTWEAAWCVQQARWRDYKSVVLRVSEAKDVGEVDRFKFYARTKVYLAGRRTCSDSGDGANQRALIRGERSPRNTKPA